MTQLEIFYQESRNIAEANALFCEMVLNGDMTRRDLAALIARRPEKWERFAGFMESLPA
jgi:hypothetical protein